MDTGAYTEGRLYEDTGRRPCDDRGREWNDAATSQGMPRIASQETEEAKKHPPLEPSEGVWSC